MSRTEVAVVGGGISGLAVAWALARDGVPFTLVESSERWGGRILTERVGGFLIEAGPDALFVQKPAPLTLCRELGLGAELVPASDPRTVYVVRGGRLHVLPPGLAAGAPGDVRAFLRSRLFSWGAKVRMGMERVVPRRRDGADESIAGFFRRRLGREALAFVGDPLLAGIHAGDPERLSLRSTMPRLAEIERRSGSLSRGLGVSWHASPAPPMFFTLRGGLESMVEAVVRSLPVGSYRTHTSVRRIGTGPSGYQLALEDGHVLDARRVVLAVPPPAASRLLSGLDLDLASWLHDVPFASTATVSLAYRREDVGHPLDGHGLLVPRSEGLRTSACSFVSQKFAHRAPEGHVLLRAFLGGVRDPEAAALGSGEMAALVERELAPLLGLRARPLFARVHVWPDAMPQMEVGHEARIQAFETCLARWPGLSVVGAGLRGTGIGHAVAEGIQAAREDRTVGAATA